MSKEAMNLLTMTDEDLFKHASKQVQALRMALDMIECEKYDRRHVRWAIIDALKEEAEQPAQQEPVASIFISGIGEREFDDWGHDLPVGRNLLYTSPPAQRKPLTDEQWQSIADTLGCLITREQKDIIEAAHGIKENT